MGESKVVRFVKEARKFLLAVSAVVSTLVASAVVDTEVGNWIAGVVGAVLAGLVYFVPNEVPGGTQEPLTGDPGTDVGL